MHDIKEEINKLLKSKTLKRKLHPLSKYLLKSLFSSDFVKRNKRFNDALCEFYLNFSDQIELNLFTNDITTIESKKNLVNDQTNLFKEKEDDNTVLHSFIKENNPFSNNNNDDTQIKQYPFDDKTIENINSDQINENNNDTQNNITNKDTYMNLNLFPFIDKEINWILDKLLEYNSEYILDTISSEDPLLEIIVDYIFSDQDPKTSKLLLSYNIIASSIELAFCLRLVTKFPSLAILPKEREFYDSNNQHIIPRIERFIVVWKNFFPQRTTKDMIIKHYLDVPITSFNVEEYLESGSYDFSELSKEEPILSKNFVLFSKIVNNNIFIFDLEEISRQLCLVDQELLLELDINSYLRQVKYREICVFNKIYRREKQFKAYILFSIFIDKSNQNRKALVENFINLAYNLKKKKNYQSHITIIKAFMLINLKNISSIWDQINPSIKHYYLNMVKEIEKIELNETFFTTYTSSNKSTSSVSTENSTNLSLSTTTNPVLPSAVTLNNALDMIKRNIRSGNIVDTVNACTEFKEFYLIINNCSRNKYSWYRNNPIYDFIKFGFKEVFRTSEWRKEYKKFSPLRFSIEDDNLIDSVIKQLENQFRKLD